MLRSFALHKMQLRIKKPLVKGCCLYQCSIIYCGFSIIELCSIAQQYKFTKCYSWQHHNDISSKELCFPSIVIIFYNIGQ